jgi:hypothetical protein
MKQYVGPEGLSVDDAGASAAGISSLRSLYAAGGSPLRAPALSGAGRGTAIALLKAGAALSGMGQDGPDLPSVTRSWPFPGA